MASHGIGVIQPFMFKAENDSQEEEDVLLAQGRLQVEAPAPTSQDLFLRFACWMELALLLPGPPLRSPCRQ